MQGCGGRRRDLGRWLAAGLVFAGGFGAASASTWIENGDGTRTVVEDDGRWQVVDIASGEVLETGAEVTPAAASSDDEPGYGGLTEAVPAFPGEEAAGSACHQVENLCEPSSFKKNGSRYFWLHYCPSVCGIDAYERVREVIDPAWDFVSLRFGSEYSASDLNGYVYTTSSHYSDQSGGMPWSGGFFNPANNQIHLPAPLGRRGAALKTLLVHELTHFRLHKLTKNEELGGSGIQFFRFLNEGLAQFMEQRLFEEEPPPEGGWSERSKNYGILHRAFEAGFVFQPLKDMVWDIRGPVELFYAQSYAVVAYIEAQYGSRAMDRLLAEVGKVRRKPQTYPHLHKMLTDTFEAGLGVDPETLGKAAEAWARKVAAAEAGQ